MSSHLKWYNVIIKSVENKQQCRNCGSTESLKVHYVKAKYIYYVCSTCKQNSMKRLYDKRKVMVFTHYGNKCNCCDGANKLFLSIDHIDNDGHEEVWPSGRIIWGRQMYQKIYKDGFPDRYQLLCMNCNFGKRMNKGVCPHKMV